MGERVRFFKLMYLTALYTYCMASRGTIELLTLGYLVEKKTRKTVAQGLRQALDNNIMGLPLGLTLRHESTK
jgi:hypothetical protein